MRRPLLRCSALLLTALLLGPVAAHAQAVDPAFAGGLQAFKEARYEEAARLLRRADRRNAEAHYLPARIYLETPLQDDRSAREAILKALDLEPDNVRYLDLRLRQYRADATNHAPYAEQLSTRKHAAQALLEHNLILDAADQPPGRYVLALQIRDTVTGQRVEATREVFLEDR